MIDVPVILLCTHYSSQPGYIFSSVALSLFHLAIASFAKLSYLLLLFFRFSSQSLLAHTARGIACSHVSVLCCYSFPPAPQRVPPSNTRQLHHPPTAPPSPTNPPRPNSPRTTAVLSIITPLELGRSSRILTQKISPGTRSPFRLFRLRLSATAYSENGTRK